MTRTQMHDYLLSLPHTQCEFKEEWGVFLYKLGDKFYAMIGANKEGTPILSMKCNPARAVELREQFSEINPGYYLNKKHWNSINIDNNLSDELLQELMLHAHSLVFESLPKKKQKELKEGAV